MNTKEVIKKHSRLICTAHYYHVLEDMEYQVRRLGYVDLPLIFLWAKLPKDFLEGVLEAEGYVETPTRGQYVKANVAGKEAK